MSAPAASALPVAVTHPHQDLLVRVWPDDDRAMPRSSAVLAAIAGLAGAVLLPDSTPGLGLLVVGLVVGAAVLPAVRGRIGTSEILFAGLAIALLAVVAVRSAEWFVSLSLLASAGLASYALSSGRSLLSVALGPLSLPMAAYRGAPWIARGLRRFLGTARTAATIGTVLRAAALSLVVVIVFGALFASADPAFATLLPEPDLGTLPLRVSVFLLVAFFAGSAAYLGAAPPRWDLLSGGTGRSVRPAEWIAPIATLNAMFTGFVGVQFTVLFGGHDHVLQTAGLTYADYARSGFGELVVVTVLTLAVVTAAARWAPRVTSLQRITLRAMLGILCGLSLVVVASALYRLHLYEETFGFTRLRLFTYVFESWLGLLFVLVLVAGIRLNGWWLPRALVATGAVAMLVLALVNPDGFIARRNVDRFFTTGKLDMAYLQTLSADAVPAVDKLPEPTRSCVLDSIRIPADGGFASWNFGRERAHDLLARRPATPPPAC